MCNNNSFTLNQCKDAVKLLDDLWKLHGDCGMAAVWLADGPRFFKMHETTPFQAVASIKEECGCKWNEVYDLIKYVDADRLY